MSIDGIHDGPFFRDPDRGTGTNEDNVELSCAMNRRDFVTRATIVGGAAVLGIPSSQFSPYAAAEEDGISDQSLLLNLKVNGKAQRIKIDPRVTLLDLLREQFGLTGTKKGCDHGQCGACTVLANGRRINSCLSLALVHDGDEITTIEGLAKGEELHPIQSAFLEHDGFQCGYCTPGQICSAVAMLEEYRRGDLSLVTTDLKPSKPLELTTEEIRERMSGNICRCGAYPGIVAAVRDVHEADAARQE